MFYWFFGKPLAPGTPAPDFELPDQDGNLVRLSSLRGKNVILVFYPADDTTVCRRQFCAFRDAWRRLEARNTVVLGLNPGCAASHASFRRRYEFPFPLLVDQGQKVAKLYRSGGVLVRRTVYLIDTQGVICFSTRGKPDPELLLVLLTGDCPSPPVQDRSIQPPPSTSSPS